MHPTDQSDERDPYATHFVDTLLNASIRGISLFFVKIDLNNLIGLTFSPGIIYSAALNLGILHGLSKKWMLGKFDELSTLSSLVFTDAGLSWLVNHSHHVVNTVKAKLVLSTQPIC